MVGFKIVEYRGAVCGGRSLHVKSRWVTEQCQFSEWTRVLGGPDLYFPGGRLSGSQAAVQLTASRVGTIVGSTVKWEPDVRSDSGRSDLGPVLCRI